MLDLSLRYWVFQFASYYPSGGLNDLRATFDSENEVQEYLKENRWDHVQLLDTSRNIILDKY